MRHPGALLRPPRSSGPDNSAELAPSTSGDGSGALEDELLGAGPHINERRSKVRSARRLAVSYCVTVFALLTLNFFLPRAMPSDPISALIDAESPTYVQSEELRAELEAYYGLDRPLLEQYVGYLGDLVQGDLGVSIRYNQPVSELIAERLPWTLLLLSTSMVLGAAVGLALGVHSAWRRGQAVDQGLLVLFMGMHNLPVFFVASMALLLFSVELGWVPLAGSSTPFTDFANPLAAVVDVAHHLVLPAAVMASGLASAYYLIMRSSLVSELGADYLMLGRAKGLRERRLKYRYAGRNSLLVVVTWSAMRLEGLVTASVLVETVFAYQGMGRLMFDAVSFRDYPTLQACFLILTMVVLTANFLAELLYTRLDPRTSA